MNVSIFFLTILLSLFSTAALSNAFVDDMQLLGKGSAYYLRFIKVYDASLYTAGPVNNQDILNGEISKCLLLDYNVSVGREDFVKAADTVLSRQFTTEELEVVRREIDLLHKSYIDVADGDTYSLCYDKTDSLTTLSLNNKELVRIQSKPFATIYFSIWLGNTSPLDDSLRDDLLARK